MEEVHGKADEENGMNGIIERKMRWHFSGQR